MIRGARKDRSYNRVENEQRRRAKTERRTAERNALLTFPHTDAH